MCWNYPVPMRENYDSDEEYQDAMESYDAAESDYIDDYVEMRQMEREYN